MADIYIMIKVYYLVAVESRQEETNQGNGHKKEVPRKSVKTRTQECSTFFL